MKAGFAKVDITPRVGVELCGFGAHLNRHSIGVRDRLWARAMAVQHADKTAVLVSCDLVGVGLDLTRAVRALVNQATGLTADSVMVHCTHTHSGPATYFYAGWGDMDPPYMNVLPHRVARAAIAAVANLADARFLHAEVPCEGIGVNREQDRDAPPLEEALRDDWRPAKPELTDTTCHVIKVDCGGRLAGFLSYFGCHPVVCCASTRYIHGDYAGVATNAIEREHPGSVGLFLQGAQGDVNTCVVHKPEAESLLALDAIAARYANSVRNGLAQAAPIPADTLASARQPRTFGRRAIPLDRLRQMLAEKQAVFAGPAASDADGDVRMHSVYVHSLRNMVARLERGESLERPTELQGIRIGPVAFLGAPFEIFQTIKNSVRAAARAPVPLVMGITNDCLGYAPIRQGTRGDYTTMTVPLILGELPFADVGAELTEALLALDAALAGGRP